MAPPAVRFQRHVLADGLGNFLRRLVLPGPDCRGHRRGIFFANSPGELPGILSAVASIARGDILIDEVAGDIEEGTEVAGSIPIDEFTDKVTFLLSWGGSDLDLTLVAPDGTVVDPAFADQNPDVEFVSASTYEFYRVFNPQSGDWQIKFEAVQTEGAIPFLVQGFGSSNRLFFGVFGD